MTESTALRLTQAYKIISGLRAPITCVVYSVCFAHLMLLVEGVETPLDLPRPPAVSREVRCSDLTSVQRVVSYSLQAVPNVLLTSVHA
jgi:hypothetical protein